MKIKTFLLLSLFLFSRSSHLSADFPVNNHIQIGGAVWPWVAYSGESLWIQLPEKKQPVAGSILQVQFRTTGLPVINQAPIALPQTSSFVTTPLTAPTVCGLYWIDFTWTKDNQVLSQSEHPFAVISNQEKGDSAYGSCVISSFKFDRRGTDRPDLALLVGTTWNRPIIEWKAIEKKKGERDWKNVDDMIHARVAGGLNLAPLVAVAPRWSGAGHVNGPPHDLVAWKAFVFDLVERYKNEVHVWGFANEINHAKRNPGWNPKVATEHLRASYEAAKKADPNCQVLFPGLSFVDLEFVEAMYQAGAKNYFDLMNVHPYGFPVAPEERQVSLMDKKACFAKVEDLRRLMERFGDKDKPVWFTEYAWNDGRQLPSSMQKHPFELLTNTELDQAKFMVRGALLSRVWGVERVFLLNFVDYQDSIKMPFSRSGMITKSLEPKLSLVAWSAMSAVLKNTVYESIYKTKDPAQYAVQLKKGTQTVWALWDSQKDSLISIPVSDGEVQLVDFWGNSTTFHQDSDKLILRIGPMPRYCITPENVSHE